MPQKLQPRLALRIQVQRGRSLAGIKFLWRGAVLRLQQLRFDVGGEGTDGGGD